MRLSHIENRLEQQISARELIRSAYDNLISVGLSSITSPRVHTRISALKEEWEKFSVVNDAIKIAISGLTLEEKMIIKGHFYFTEGVFSQTHEEYLNSLEKMNSLLEIDSTEIPRSSSSQNISQHSSNTTTVYNRTRLPRIDIPKFNGSPSEWLSFKDLFSSLVLDHPSLSSVEKLQYLKMSLIGSAAPLLKNTMITADNFQKAWEALISFYENKRLLVNATLLSLFTLKRMSKESANELEQLYTSVMQLYRTLETLDRPVQTWDDVFVFVTVQRLDSESVKAWEHHLGSSKEPPSWSQFNDFLIARLLSLQAYEKSRGGKLAFPSQSNQVKAHYNGKSKDGARKHSNVCPLCSENHYIAACSQYTTKSIPQRLELVKRKGWCYNCLGTHRISACRVTKRCYKCGQKHHTSIHQDRSHFATLKKDSVKTDSSATSSAKLDDAQSLNSS